MIKDKDFGSRDNKGNWKPFEKIIPMPRYIIPFKPIKLFKWIFGWNGYIFPMQFIWAIMAILVWFFFDPTNGSNERFRFIFIYLYFFKKYYFSIYLCWFFSSSFLY